MKTSFWQHCSFTQKKNQSIRGRPFLSKVFFIKSKKSNSFLIFPFNMSNRYNQRQKRNNQGQGQGHYIAPISQNFVSAVQKQPPPTPTPAVVKAPAPAPVVVQPPPPVVPVVVAPVVVKSDEPMVTTEDSPQKPKWMGVRKKLSAKVIRKKCRHFFFSIFDLKIFFLHSIPGKTCSQQHEVEKTIGSEERIDGFQ
jgi:hypothetical protein